MSKSVDMHDLSGDFYEIKAIVKNVKDISIKYTFNTDIY